MAFQGTFDFTLDAKNRLTIPTRHRAAFADGVVLSAGLEPCIGIWRPADYEGWHDRMLAGQDPLSREYRQLSRHLTANATAVELDGAGRVMVPAFLARYAGLGREVSLIGAGAALEIWDRERWAAYNGDLVSNIADIAAGLGG